MNRIVKHILYRHANNKLILNVINKYLEANTNKLHIYINLIKLNWIPDINLNNVIDKYYEFVIKPEYYQLIKNKLLSILTIFIYRHFKIIGKKAIKLRKAIKKYIINNYKLIIKEYYKNKYSKTDLQNILEQTKSANIIITNLNTEINKAIMNIVETNPRELGFAGIDPDNPPEKINLVIYTNYISEDKYKNNIINNIIKRFNYVYNNLIEELKKTYGTNYNNVLISMIQKHFNRLIQIAYLQIFPNKKYTEHIIKNFNKKW